MVLRSAPLRVAQPMSRPSPSTTGATDSAGLAEEVVDVGRFGAVLDDHELAAHHVLQLREAVEAGGVVLGEDALRAAVVVDHHDGAVRPLVDEAERVADGVVRTERDGRVVHEVAGLHVLDDRVGDVERDVLRQHGDATAAGDGLGHAPAGDGSHVRHDHRDGGAEPIGRGEIDVETRRHAATGWAP